MSPSDVGPAAPEEHPNRRHPDLPEDESARLHPAAIGVWAWERIVTLILALLFAGLLPGLLSLVGLALLGVFVLVLGLRYLRFRWRVGPEAVVIEEGVLFRQRRIIPRERVQTVDLKRGIVHRLLGVVEVRIEAIGGTETQGKLVALTPRRAEDLRRTLLRARETAFPSPDPQDPEEALTGSIPGASGPGPDEEVWARVGPGRLVLAGLTGGRVGVMAALLGVLFQYVPETGWTGFVGRMLQEAPDPASPAGVRLLALLGVGVLLAAFLLSVMASVAAHWDFTVSTIDRSLAVRRGLITEHRDTVPLARIQAVRVEENVVRRLLGLGAVRAVVAGRAAGPQADPASGLLLPLGTREEAYRIARDAVQLGGQGIPELAPMPPRALSRRIVRAVAASALGGAGLAGLSQLPAGPLAGVSPWTASLVGFAAFLVPGALLARGAYRSLGWADLGSHVVVREGVLNRRTSFVPVDRLQTVETTESPFQRWSGLATLQLQVARPLMDPTPRAPDMSRAGAEGWREDLARRGSGSRTRALAPELPVP